MELYELKEEQERVILVGVQTREGRRYPGFFG